MCTTNVLLLLALLFLCGHTAVFSKSLDHDRSEEETPLPKPEIRTLHVYSDIKYRYATTVITSRVANVAEQAQEVGFIVLLPETAFISEFLMVIKDKVYKAYVKGKDEAKAEYNEAVSQGRTGAHVEVSARNSNKFSVSVNIEAHGKVDFNLTYEELLTRSLGVYSHVVNLNPGQIVKNMSVTVTITESANITRLEVPDLKMSNEISQNENSTGNELATIERPSGESAVVRWIADPSQQRQIAQDGINGQLVVKYDVDRDSQLQQVLVDEGYFVHYFAPDSLPPLRKFAIFVLDYSGSMRGRKLEQLQDAMKTILSDMSSNDYFSIVLFSYGSGAWSPSRTFSMDDSTLSEEHMIRVTPESVKLAIDFLKSYDDLGLTNIISGLRTGLKLADIGKDVFRYTSTQPPEPLIMFLTDGQPNVEMDRPHGIVREVKRLNNKRVPIFSLGFGYGADMKFLKKLSLSNNAFARTIYEASDANLQLKNFYRQIASPLLSNITFSYLPGQIDNETSSRIHFPLLFSGSELVVVGKLRNNSETKDVNEIVHGGELTGMSSHGPRTFPILFNPYLSWFPPRWPRPTHFPPVVPPEESSDGHVPSHLEKVWAFMTIKQLLDNAAIEKADRANATKQKALELALKYSFVTPLTSLVVVKPNATSSPVDAETVRPGMGEHSAPTAYRSSGIIPRMHNLQGPGHAAWAPSFQSSLLIDRSIYMDARNIIMPHRKRIRFNALPTETVTSTPPPPPLVTTNAPAAVQKLTLHEVTWLSNYTGNSASNVTVQLHIPGTEGNTRFWLAKNEPDTVFGNCMMPNGTSGECRHFVHCVLQVFINEVEDFLPYRCNIASGYLGACCPII